MTTATWAGKSGSVYAFELFPIGTEFNPVSAVYILCRPAPSLGITRRMEALYVGETESLHDRLNSGLIQHDGLKRATQAGATYVGVYRTEGTANRARIETDLRHALNPSCNAEAVPQNALMRFTLRT